MLQTQHDEVFAALPAALGPANELLNLLAQHLAQHHPSVVRRDCDRLLNLATGESWSLAGSQGCRSRLHPLDVAGRLVQEDLCLLMPDTPDP